MSTLLILFLAFTLKAEIKTAQLYFFRYIAFHKKYDLYCTTTPCGYYKYEVKFGEATIYLTYEGREFYRQSLFDENIWHYSKLYPLSIWTNSRGELFRLKNGYGPVIDRDKKGTGHDYGYARDHK